MLGCVKNVQRSLRMVNNLLVELKRLKALEEFNKLRERMNG